MAADVQDSAFGGELFAGLADDWENLRLLVQRTQQNLVGDLETCSTVLQEIADRHREADTFHFADEAEVITDDGRAAWNGREPRSAGCRSAVHAPFRAS